MAPGQRAMVPGVFHSSAPKSYTGFNTGAYPYFFSRLYLVRSLYLPQRFLFMRGERIV